MAISIHAAANVAAGSGWQDQHERIAAALGRKPGRLPRVDGENLSRYYKYLSKHLILPFASHFPIPKDAQQETDFRCAVVELLDPAEYLGDELDGIFCKTRRERVEVDLPLIDMYLPDGHPNVQLIEDYWYWFWNWNWR